jgi:hypothetical protein
VKFIGCSVFRAALEHALGDDVEVQWLPSRLDVLPGRLDEALAAALQASPGAACLYGACSPDIDGLLAQHGGRRLAVRNCVEAFLSPDDRAAFGDRAFIITPTLLRDWRSVYVEGLGWDEIDGRINFGRYDVIVLLDFGLEPIDDLTVLEFFDFTQTPIEIVPASLEWFREQITELLSGD